MNEPISRSNVATIVDTETYTLRFTVVDVIARPARSACVTTFLSPRLRVTANVDVLHSPDGATVNVTSCSEGVSFAVTEPVGIERMALARRCKATEVECDASVRTRERTVTVEASDPLMARVRTRNST